jgi:hypothetical protein
MSLYKKLFEIISSLPYYETLSSLIGEPFVKILIFVLGLLIYGIIVWEFYSTLSKRDLFKISLKPYMSKKQMLGEIITFILKYTFLFPIYTFVWFLILSLFILLLSKSLALEEIFLVSIALISFTRAAAYYKEELAADVAKIIPLSLLVIFITDPAFFSFELAIKKLDAFVSSFPGILKYLLFAIAIEWILRIFYAIKVGITERKISLLKLSLKQKSN